MKRIRKLHSPLTCLQRLRAILNDEATADREERAFLDDLSRGVERRNPQSVRVLRSCARRKHRCTIEDQVPRLIEFDASLPRKLKTLL